ncbi:LexA family protein [Paenibacillus sp. FSL H8-0034]|uniref:LexA family protein n=1 Tax=Paenibacillus sp. FSL H8-0034 TaxID=2954671 RepID=UPI0030F84222
MSQPLTRREADSLEYIRSFMNKNGYSPTLREISDAMRYGSSSTAFYLVESLEQKGYISKEHGGARTIRLLEKKSGTRRIYLASSWKNAELVKGIKGLLVSSGFEVDAFCDPSEDRFVFSFDLLPNIENLNARTVLQEPIVQRAFQEDKKWLDWADTVLLILPAGKSAHLEAGYAAGAGKRLVIYQDEFPAGEYDVMYGFADLVSSDLQGIIEFFNK